MSKDKIDLFFQVDFFNSDKTLQVNTTRYCPKNRSVSRKVILMSIFYGIHADKKVWLGAESQPHKDQRMLSVLSYLYF